MLLGEVVDIDVDSREVILDDHSRVPYDTVIFATGSTHSYFGHPEWATLAPGLKTVEDATEIRTRVLLAFERAEKETRSRGPAREPDFRDRGRRPDRRRTGGRHRRNFARHLEAGFPQHQSRRRQDLSDRRRGPGFADLSAEALAQPPEASLTQLGVHTRTEPMVTGIDEQGVTVTAAGNSENDANIPAKTVLWAAGVQASPLGKVLADRTGV